jgi:hypothetical protein
MLNTIEKSLREMLNSKQGIKKAFRLNNDELFLYTVLDVSKKNQFLCWNLKCLFNNLNAGLRNGHPCLPFSLTPLSVFPSLTDDPSNLINFQPILIKSFYNQNHYAFFFPDETVTDSAVYTSANHPSYIIGTNYGRIFIISMF